MYNLIKTDDDVRLLEESSNGLHDGIIVSIDFQNHGINRTGEYSIAYEHDKVEMKLRIRVLSDFDKLIELYFKEVQEYRLDSYPFDEFFGFFIEFDTRGYVTWHDSLPGDCSANFVCARELSWRIVSE